MLQLLYLYVQAFLHNMVLLVMGGALFAADFVLKAIWTRYKRWAESHARWRRTIEILVIAGTAWWAGFIAWRDEYQTHQTDIGTLQRAQSDLKVQKGLADERWWEINGPDGLNERLKESKVRIVGSSKMDSAVVPKIEVTRFEFTPLQPDDGTHDKVLRIVYKNIGQKSAYAPVVVDSIRISAPITEKELSEESAKVFGEILKTPPPKNTEMEVGQEAFRPTYRIKNADYEAVMKGSMTLYVYAALAYVDEQLPKGEAWINEFAAVQSGSVSEFEILHQRTYRHSLSK